MPIQLIAIEVYQGIIESGCTPTGNLDIRNTDVLVPDDPSLII
jgi:hypothetical protein